MANQFQKVTEPNLNAVTVQLYSVDGKPSGDASGPTTMSGGKITSIITPQDGSQTAEQAVATGIRLANEMNVPMVVIDDEELWDPNWGNLVV